MSGLREGIEKANFQTPPATKLLEVASKFGLYPPVSLLRLAELLKPEMLDWDTGSVSSGDDQLVKAAGHLRLTSTGFWKFTGTINDGGDGAKFGFVMGPRFIDSSGSTWLVTEADKLSDNEELPFNKSGQNLWIARNWDGVQTAGFSWQLQASTTKSFGEILGIVIGVIVLAIAIKGATECNENDSWHTETNSDGSTTATCTVN